ncbi:MAG: Deoxyuridine 5'-triphosphate nucleotidohydrolase [Dehalococcoidia bacterium]|nr:Deoxyuridine 5'-triphosphate nucleotidohydrolase [Chloroflexota bacterium]
MDTSIKISPIASGKIPSKAFRSDAGYDCYSAVNVVLEPQQRRIIPLGFALALPDHWCALLLPRSGWAAKKGITVINSPGLIDSGYRGEVKACLVNHGDDWLTVNAGDRVCQILFMPLPPTSLEVVSKLPPSDRDVNGFGSTGV